MKNILITSDCLVKGEGVQKGDILKDVDNRTAAILLTSGRAALAPKEEIKKADAPQAEKPKKKAAKKKVAKTDED